MSAFRSLAPSNQQAESSFSSSARFTDAEQLVEEGALAVVAMSLNANGALPVACLRWPVLLADRPGRRCATRKLECIYEPHTKTHKDDLIKEIENLRQNNASLQNHNREIRDDAYTLDTDNRNLREEAAWQRTILQTIGSNGHDREIISRLRRGDTHQSIAEWLHHENPDFARGLEAPTTHRRLIDVVKLYEMQGLQEDGLSRQSPSPSEADIPWTKVTTSHKLIGHLFDLYFTWLHPVHMLFSELDFKHDFRINLQTNCSASLVNAICAMGCNMLESEDVGDRRNRIDVATLRDGFMNEARATLTPSSYGYMTSIQALAIMYLVELSSGKARKAIGYLRSAIDNLKTSNGPPLSEEANEITVWGLHTLNTSSASFTYQKLYAPPTPREAIFQHVDMERDHALWRFYRHPGDERELPTRPSFAIVTACYQAGLFRIIDDSLDLYSGARGQVSAERFLEVYRKYMDWKSDLPPVIANVDVADQPLPHILYLHVQYHTALVQHVSPLLHCGLFSTDDYAELEPPASDTVEFCLEVLQQTSARFALCGPLQSLFCQTAEECGIQLSDEMRAVMGSFDHYVMDDILDACTRLSYTQPLNQILVHIDPEIANDWPGEWQKQVVAGVGQARRGSASGGRRDDGIAQVLEIPVNDLDAERQKG
ncbi:MAG: hypothetical protein ASARMPRED_008709 [Alectoria sarmentosa]|nr:MAG: hypothetical protein ASARMPRED_008709 [Alectoria sarmentosa]